MLAERGIIRIGMEIEIATWEKPRTYQSVAQDLVQAGFMPNDPMGWKQPHKYGCKCDEICGRVRSGNVYIPPMVSLTYDASLPASGGEFVTSPAFLFDHGIEALREIWNITTQDAVWTDELPNRRGNGMCSPSIHLHVSSTIPGEEDANPRQDGPTEIGTWLTNDLMDETRVSNASTDDITHALVLYGPELLQLASVCGIQRGLVFRKPTRYADQRGHHGLIHVRKALPYMLHIEWRLFEAAYDQWQYIESAAYLSAGLTRALQREEAYHALMAAGYTRPYNRAAMEQAIGDNDTELALSLASLDRLHALRELVIEELDDDPAGINKLIPMFDVAERNIQ